MESLEPGGTLIESAESRTLILTGQSAAPAADLSPAQRDFLAEVTPRGWCSTRAGFPYHRDLLSPLYQEPALLGAACRNARQTALTMTSRRFRTLVRASLQTILDRTSNQVWIFAGSCGLQFANAVWPDLVVPGGLAVQVIALGPVCFGPLRLGGAQFTALQGARDWWSRLLYRGPVHHRLGCGHLGYWSCREVRECICRSLHRPSPVI